METIQDIVENHEDLSVRCRELGELLGIGVPVGESVLYSALHDPSYAHNLLVARRQPLFLQYLLSNPPHQPERQPDDLSNTRLIKKASEAIWGWAKTGFSTVDETTFQTRFTACLHCPHLADRPHTMLYNLAAAKKPDEKICTLCGCLVSRKAQLPSESCPDRHPSSPDLSRWGEPIS